MDTATETPAPAEIDLALDRDRDHATVHGETEHAVAFEQDGLPFDAAGELVQAALTPELRAMATRRARARLAEKAAQAAWREAMGDDAPADDRPRVKTFDPDAEAEHDVDLVAWYHDKKRVRFDLVAKKMAELWGEKPVSKADARDLMRHKGAV